MYCITEDFARQQSMAVLNMAGYILNQEMAKVRKDRIPYVDYGAQCELKIISKLNPYIEGFELNKTIKYSGDTDTIRQMEDMAYELRVPRSGAAQLAILGGIVDYMQDRGYALPIPQKFS